ncbi:[protein-PII] uridylyltransferase [Ferrimonas sp. SCSIO 43195]|uniref:[protein-PII] uridylyltransferase n=1 Tax=Ferrimonas sp. SCSIO 43195 TaxID=2822844 RepID=UPI002075EC06|nr:[protein-PII] uridylyltransferase [Ferrimonas sp. SCSIO 43195]USD36777.1 [protein-PII] uridylyltransferase [Ferrimonas sp. SCSIO 43195]
MKPDNTALTPIDIRQQLQQQREQLQQQFAQGDAIGVLLAERSHQIDTLLQQLWQQHQVPPCQTALVAVGGYGRGELHPHSDIDLLVLTTEQCEQATEEAIGTLLTTLWDSKLDVGHSVRSVEQTFEQACGDVTIATNLLESRFLCGDIALYQQLQQRLASADFWPISEFYLAKRDEQRSRHAKSSGFDLEPNIKACPGGLRDIQTITWVAMRHFNASCMADLVSHGFLAREELEELNTCRNFLWRLRFALHSAAGRPEDRLLFDHQPKVAQLLGYTQGTQLPVEQMMKRYYRTIRAVRELNQMLLQLFKGEMLPHLANRDDPVNLDQDFCRMGRYIAVRHEGVFEQPDKILTLFSHCARNAEIEVVAAPTLRLLRNARRRQKQPLSERPECRSQFMAILRHANGIKALSLMHRHGILGTYLKAWQQIVGQMQFDLFHAYTVDEHTHRLLQFIDRFADPAHKEIFPLGSVLIDQLPKKGLLVLAAIFHDIAKGRGGDHSELGAVDTLQFCQLHNLNDHDGRLVAWLVQNHLLMSVTAQRRDINDPEVIQTFAEAVSDTTRLSYLYCLTVADICATNDNLWNSWKGSLLRQLYQSTRGMLLNGLEKPVDTRARIREHQNKALYQLSKLGFVEADVTPLWHRFSADYFLRFSPLQVCNHTQALLERKDEQPLVTMAEHESSAGTELFVYCRDRPGLFATVMAVLDGKNVIVHDAQIFTSKDGYALDSFVILEQDGSRVVHPSRINSIRNSLTRMLLSPTPAKVRQRPLPRRMRQFKVRTQVNFLPGKRKQGSMVEIITLDSPGLLARIGQVVDQCRFTIHSAKITTVGEKAEDLFMLANDDGLPLTPDQQNQFRDSLTQALTTE